MKDGGLMVYSTEWTGGKENKRKKRRGRKDGRKKRKMRNERG